MDFISPIGRLVQGSITLEAKTDMQTQKPKLDDQGQPIKECFIALAIRKDDPALPAFYALYTATARAEFPHLFDPQGNCLNPKFAWKVQDGDGVDTNGQSVKDKPGFAGHYIFKMGTRYLPKCFHAGKYDPAQQIQNPQEVIKRGYFIRIAGRLSGNGVSPTERNAVPGLFVSPNLIELVAFGEEITSGPDAAKTFGAAPLAGALPPGASSVPVGAPAGLPGLSPPPLPGVAAAPLSAPPLPGMPAVAAGLGAPPMGLGAPPLPGLGAPPAAPQFTMQASAQGATREQLHGQGWSDAQLIAGGHMVQNY